MSDTILNPISIIITIAAALGVFIHDTQIYNAAKASTLDPIAAINFVRIEESKLLQTEKHIHSESGVFYDLQFRQPSNQPRTKDDKKYTAIKRLVSNNYGTDYFWPTS